MASANSDDDEVLEASLFEEPEGFYPPPKPPTFGEHKLLNGDSIKLRMVGQSPLWGHMIWNAARVMTNYIEKRPDYYNGKRILELGAGAALPSLICAKIGDPKAVIITDYPDPDLLDNIQYNINNVLQLADGTNSSKVQCKGHIWGREPEELLACLPSGEREDKPGFDFVILSDLIFNHSQHEALLETIKATMSPQGVALVFFTPHRTWLLSEDLKFFERAKSIGFEVEKVWEEMVENPMFENDKGPRDLRRTVFGWEVRWPKTES